MNTSEILEQTHRMFLKNKVYTPGKYIPDLINCDNIIIDFIELKNQLFGSVIFIISEYCTACRIDPIVEFVNQYDKFKYILFFEGSVKYSEVIVDLNRKVEVVNVDLSKLSKEMDFNSVPWIFALNKRGQILSGGLFNTTRDAEIVTHPLLKVFYSHNLME